MPQLKLSLLFLTFFSFSTVCFAQEQLRGGFILPLTGPSSFWGSEMRSGAQLAYEQLSEKQRSRITLEFEDDAFSARNTVSAYRKLKQSGELDLVVVFGSSAAEALVSTVERDKIPMVVITALESISTGKSYVMRFWLSSQGQAEMAVNQLNSHSLDRVAVVVTSFSALLDVEQKFKEIIGDKSRIVIREEVPSDISDFRALIARILNRKPQAIYILLLPGQTSAFMKQLRANDSKIPVFGNSTIENGTEVKAANGAMEGIIYPGPAFNAQFIKEFEVRFNRQPEMAAGNGYDLVKMLAIAEEKEIFSAEKLNTFLHNLENFNGSLGTYGASEQNAFDVQPVTKVVEKGSFNYYEKD